MTNLSKDIIITMLPEGHHVRSVIVDGPKAVLTMEKSSKKKLIIDCSTIDTKISIDVGKAVHESGLGTFADAAVSVGLLLILNLAVFTTLV